jgi:sterol desaturase/sphingolipid hydroxylase (fatty acid hydroxylase superfamily)
VTHFIKTVQPYSVAIVFLLLYLAEHIFPQQKNINGIAHDLKNFAFGMINAVIIFFGGYYFQEIISYINNHHFGLFNMIAMPFAISLMIQIIVIDIFMYWWHRANHMLPMLWRFHKLHHSDEQLNSTSALRFHAVELSLSYIARLLVFPLFGISVTAIILYSLIFFPVVILHHSNIKIGDRLDLLLRKIIVSPRMHRIHHSNIKRETDSNYSSVLSIWDTLFESYIKKPAKETIFGLDKGKPEAINKFSK